ncbi:MAG: adenylosuccinate lyase [Chitinophagales bacterium]
MLEAISPIDGRYAAQTQPLSAYFSEYALIRYRIHVEVEYCCFLLQLQLPGTPVITTEQVNTMRQWVTQCSPEDATRIKTIEKTTNHDVKAVEYFLKEKMQQAGWSNLAEWIHFGLTSQDVNNTAIPLSIRDALHQVYFPALDQLILQLKQLAHAWKQVPMLARTHGQPASPTLLGKEFNVFVVRLQHQKNELERLPHQAKFGGATGNFNAHAVAFPHINWHQQAEAFIQSLQLNRSHPTTQIEHYDYLAAQCDAMKRIHTILIDLCRDCWSYIAIDYFKQEIKPGEVGSSAMPHKVNPIDFENAEGNLGLANALLEHLAAKLPVSRLQRDLTDSTVLRNIGVPFAHALISMNSIQKGLGKLRLNPDKINADLDANWSVLAEAIQTILRRENYPQPYETLKALTRGQHITRETIHQFIQSLDVSDAVKNEMMALTPQSYIGQ